MLDDGSEKRRCVPSFKLPSVPQKPKSNVHSQSRFHFLKESTEASNRINTAEYNDSEVLIH
jgi:hypothetical protein